MSQAAATEVSMVEAVDVRVDVGGRLLKAKYRRPDPSVISDEEEYHLHVVTCRGAVGMGETMDGAVKDVVRKLALASRTGRSGA